jgi:excinuclease UvrABC nuclease subunit
MSTILTDPTQWNIIDLQSLHNLPNQPGCYSFIDREGNVVYLGRSKSLWNRLRNIHTHNGYKRIPSNTLSHVTYSLGWDIYDKEKELITTLHPIYCKDPWW